MEDESESTGLSGDGSGDLVLVSVFVTLVVIAVSTATAIWRCVAAIWRYVKSHRDARRPSANQSHTRQVRRSQLAKHLNPDEIGSRFNQWRKPDAYFGPGEEDMKSQLCSRLGAVTLTTMEDESESTGLSGDGPGGRVLVSVFVTLVVIAVSTATAIWRCVAAIWRYVKSKRDARRPSANQSHTRQVRRSQLAKHLNPDEIGSRFNQWRKPDAYFGPGEEDMKSQLCSTLGMEDFDIKPDKWREATEIADCVIRMMLAEVRKEAKMYKLSIEKQVIRQGSAREGLKVSDADEFDVLVQFSIEGLSFEVESEHDSKRRTLPEIARLRVYDTRDNLARSYTRLLIADVFRVQNGLIYLNSRKLHEAVFTAIIDKASKTVNEWLDVDEDCTFRIRRSINQPAVTIKVDVESQNPAFDARQHVTSTCGRYILQAGVEGALGESLKRPHYKYSFDVDLVPSLLICNDKVPDPSEFGTYMDCPRYAVFKWVRDNHPFTSYGVEPETIWRMDSSGYEKHLLDVARRIPEQRYILTAQRVLKAYFLYEKKKDVPPPQIVTVLRSYFLKQVAFYCILYFTVINKVQLSGVKEALTILIDLLEICLQEQRLPHFSHTNPWLVYMFPDYDVGSDALRYDVFHTISGDALNQARLDIWRRVRPTLENFMCDLKPVAKQIKDKFREFIVEGDYMGKCKDIEELHVRSETSS